MLILDEPTSSLSSAEAGTGLFALIDRLSARGVAILWRISRTGCRISGGWPIRSSACATDASPASSSGPELDYEGSSRCHAGALVHTEPH